MSSSRNLARRFYHSSRIFNKPGGTLATPKESPFPSFAEGEQQSQKQSHQSGILIRQNGHGSPNQAPARPLAQSAHPAFSPNSPPRIVMGITGATGAVYSIKILKILRKLEIETHLVISKWALATMKYETSLTEAEIRGLATRSYTAKELSAPIASGSFQHDGMMIVPCSMKTLSAVRTGFGDDLIARAADVTLKEGRKLLLAVRETPLSDIHLDNMLFLRRAGAIIFPPMPAFYTRPKTMDELIEQGAGRMLDQMGIYTENFERWEGFRKD